MSRWIVIAVAGVAEIGCCVRYACSPVREELALLPHVELAVRIAGAYQLIALMTVQVEGLCPESRPWRRRTAGWPRGSRHWNGRQGKTSSNSSKQPSSDSPYKKEPGKRRDRVWGEGQVRSGWQPGTAI